jgi:MFS family permease
MGGNVGDALAPLVVGGLLPFFSWRDVVLMNVIPGIAMSALILLYVGRFIKLRSPPAPPPKSRCR